MPVWHASLVLRDAVGGIVPAPEVDKKTAKLAWALASRLLDGVGAGEDVRHVKQLGFHLRRRLSVDELRRIDQAWLAIEPVDMG